MSIFGGVSRAIGDLELNDIFSKWKLAVTKGCKSIRICGYDMYTLYAI